MKRVLIFITLICFILTSNTASIFAQANAAKTPPLSMQVLGKKVEAASSPIMHGGNIYLPLRAVAERLGFKASWNASKRAMTVTKGKFSAVVTVGSLNATVDKKTVKLDHRPLLQNARCYVPISFIQKYFDYNTTYNKTQNLVTISTRTALVPTPTPTPTPFVQLQKSIFVAGREINSEDKPIFRNNIVYLPLRVIAESLQYKVAWDAKMEIMEIAKDSTSVTVFADEQYIVFNNYQLMMEEKAFLSNGKLYVPSGFFSGYLDYEVSYDREKNQAWVDVRKESGLIASRGDGGLDGSSTANNPNITANILDIVFDDNGGFPQLDIIADAPVSYKTQSLTSPDRLVIDIQNANMATSFTSKDINKADIQRVRIGQFTNEPRVVRVVVDLVNQRACKVVTSTDRRIISLVYANILKPVAVRTQSGISTITIDGSSDLDFSVDRLQESNRLVVDIKRAVFDQGEQNLAITSPVLSGVRTGQLDVGTARIVLDISPNAFFDVKQMGKQAVISVSNTAFSVFDYRKFYNSAYVDLNLISRVEHQASIDERTSTLNIMIPSNINMEARDYAVNDNLLEYISITKGEQDGRPYTLASFKMKSNVAYELMSPALTNQIKLAFKHKPKSADQLTIVIDAGHGGRDSGAVAKDGTREKDLALDVAHRLNRTLQSLGFKTIMTRTDDRYLDLATRTHIANSNYADFFISIHFNSFTTAVPKGIETLYFPNVKTAEYPIDNKEIAKIFQNELLSALKRPSRGTVARPNLYVLNKTNMPAILAELGFMSNPEELVEIKKPEYRENSAKALAVAIVRYFKEVQGIDLEIDTQAIYKTNLKSEVVDPTKSQDMSTSSNPAAVDINNTEPTPSVEQNGTTNGGK